MSEVHEDECECEECEGLVVLAELIGELHRRNPLWVVGL